eukprot:1688727-Rhodomonas_salina.1
MPVVGGRGRVREETLGEEADGEEALGEEADGEESGGSKRHSRRWKGGQLSSTRAPVRVEEAQLGGGHGPDVRGPQHARPRVPVRTPAETV